MDRDWWKIPCADDHHVGIGRERGFTFDVWLHGWRVATAWYTADYFRRIPEPKQGVLL